MFMSTLKQLKGTALKPLKMSQNGCDFVELHLQDNLRVYFHSWVKMSLKSDTILSLLPASKHLGLSCCTHLSTPHWMLPAGGSTWGLMPRDNQCQICPSPGPFGFSSPWLTQQSPGLKKKNQCLPWALHSRGHKKHLWGSTAPRGTCYNSRKIFSDFYTRSKLLLLTF